MISVFVVVGIEMFFASKGAGHVHPSEYSALDNDASDQPNDFIMLSNGQQEPGTNVRDGRERSHALSQSQEVLFAQRSRHVDSTESLGDTETSTRSPSASSLIGDEGQPMNSGNKDEYVYDMGYPGSTSGSAATIPPRHRPTQISWPRRDSASSQGGAANKADLETPNADQEAQRLLLQCLLLEAGILFHSIFIGMALSVATGTPFVVLLIAISFHQFFEGLALGSRIAAISAFGPGSPRPWLMALAYGATTPIGQAIGLIVHRLYDPLSEAGLLTVGFMNSISSGLLIFAGLVELLAEDFLAERSYQTMRGRSRLESSGAVVCGALLMALVGAWA